MAKQIIGSGKSDEIRSNQEAAGIPDSKPFVAPHAEGSAEERILKCHISGVQISELNLDPQVLGALDYYATDEGIAERNARPEMREPSGIRLGKAEFEHALDQRRDDVIDRDMDLYQARDPFKEIADAYTSPGMAPKMLSASKLKTGSRDHEIVKYPAGHPHAGDPVMSQGMVLGQMPARKAAARNKFWRDKPAALLQEVENRHRQTGGTVSKD